MSTYPDPAVADAAEDEAIDRYRRRRRFAADVVEAVRRADAVTRLESAIGRFGRDRRR